MNPPASPGSCTRCSAALAASQRYCLECGERRGELPPEFRPPERVPEVAATGIAAISLPARRSFGAVGTVVLASGVLIGAAIGPALTPTSFASAAGQVVLVASGPVGAGATGLSQQGGGTTTGAGAGAQLAAPTGNVPTPPPNIVQAPQGPAPAPSAPVTPAASSPAAPTTPSTPTPAPTPAPVPDPTVAGLVVHASHDNHEYVVATNDGQLIALHAKKAATLGDRVKTTVKALQNGTFQELKPKLNGHADKATFHGTVTFADAAAGTYTVSAHGVSLLVHLPPPAPQDPAATTPPPPPPQPPAVGTLTTVDVTIKQPPPPDPAAPAPAGPPPKPTLEEVTRKDGAAASGDLDLEAIVRDPDPAQPSKLIVSADDAGESPSTLALTIPPKFDVSKLKTGTVIIATVKRETDGSLTLVTATDDSNRKAADSAP